MKYIIYVFNFLKKHFNKTKKGVKYLHTISCHLEFENSFWCLRWLYETLK